MSEETRRQRLIAQAEVDLAIEALQEQILVLEERIERLQHNVPPELPEDLEWRLEQMSPSQRMLHDLATKMFTAQNKILESILQDNVFITSTGSDASIRINIPNDFTVTTVPPPKKDPL